MYIKELDTYPKNWEEDVALINRYLALGKKIMVVTSQLTPVKDRMKKVAMKNISDLIFLTCDATVMKTVARVNPTLYLMNGAVVKNKWSWTEFKNLN